MKGMESRVRHASPPHNLKRRDWGCGRHEEHRRGARSLSPARKHSGRTRLDPEFSISNGRRESVKEERYISRSVNKFRRSSIEAERDGDFRMTSDEVRRRDNFSKQAARDVTRRPLLGEETIEELKQPLHDARREDDFRRSSWKASMEFANSDELFSSLSDKMHLRKYSPSHCCDGEEDVHHNYFYPGLTNNAGNNDLELPDRRKGNQFASGSGEGIIFDSYGMLLKKSILLEDGTVRTFFTLPPDAADPLCKPSSYSTDDTIGCKTVIPYATGNVNFGSTNSVAELYGDDARHLEADRTYNLQYSRLSDGEVFDKEGRKMVNYSKSAVYPVSLPRSKISVSASDTSRLPISSSCGGHRDSLHAWSKDFPNGKLCDKGSLHAWSEDFSNGKLCGSSTSERHRQSDMYGKENGSMKDMYAKENGSLLHVEDLSSNEIQPYLRRQMHGVEVAGYIGNIGRNSSEATLTPHDSYDKGRQISSRNYNYTQREEAWQHGSVKSHLDVHKTDHMENSVNLKNHYSAVKKDTAVQSDPLDDYGNIHGSPSPRAISSGLRREPFRSRKGDQPSVSRIEVFRSLPTRYAREERPFGKEASVVGFRKTARNRFPETSDDLHRSNLSPLSRSLLPIRDLDKQGPDKRVLKRKHIDEDNDRGRLQRRWLNDQVKSRKFQEMDCYENGWTDQEGHLRGSIRPGRSFHDDVLHRVPNSRSISVNKSSDMRGHLYESKPQLKISRPKKQMSSSLHYDYNSSARKEEQDFHHPCRFQKHSGDYIDHDRLWNRNCEKIDPLNDREPVQISDLPEDSEAFKQQVQKAFLRFAKVLNENPGERKRYEEKGKCGSLLCIVCSSLSKDYVNTHSLVMHAFNTQKVGLKAEHLGLHKALCVLMGWNYAVAPDNANAYQSLSAPDAIAMKEDLILWPPLVIIHTSCFEKKKDGSQDVTYNLEMDDVLRGLGFGGGKTKAVDNGNTSRGTFVVKFFPTFSGLQEAERLHKYCEENHRGRNDWVQVQSQHKSQRRVGKVPDKLQDDRQEENGRVFYGYIGIAGDLEEVDFDTRRRSLVKSRKDIEAIADGPVLGA
ncbi:hypothetical protein KI387_001591 [Taxus chinensis]|uniref:XS domain-containing protein n=1 Tax=Taxus chinensis TaxID=29808 RepID=A0AA38GV99_TAXCH|nr:hypothetical protein KI387_001591 [Taxus chinensis]